MIILYNAALFLYYFLILLSSPFNSKAKLFLKGRKNLFNKLIEKIEPENEIAWFHCSSLGEFEQGRPVIEEFKSRYKSFKILLTFFSPSGYEIRKNYAGADYIFYLPLDFKANAKTFLKIVNPRIAFFVKYEFWYNYLIELKKNNIPVYIFSANFRNEQLFFKPYGKWYRSILYNFEHIFVLNKASSDLLKTFGITNVSVAGDTRFDRVYSISINSIPVPLVEIFKENKQVIIAGSTWKNDIDIIADYINSAGDNLKFIIASHEVNNSTINHICNSIKSKLIKYSEANENNIHGNNVLVIDNIGMLSSLYNYAEIAYIGGGFDKGIHNLLEAATYGMPVLFGPNNTKFIEAQELIQLGAGFEISDLNDFQNIVNDLISNKNKLSDLGFAAKTYVKNNLGATERILGTIDLFK
jgi:3-deoxy-D-manno-octulosonic-acid transferase